MSGPEASGGGRPDEQTPDRLGQARAVAREMFAGDEEALRRTPTHEGGNPPFISNADPVNRTDVLRPSGLPGIGAAGIPQMFQLGVAAIDRKLELLAGYGAEPHTVINGSAPQPAAIYEADAPAAATSAGNNDVRFDLDLSPTHSPTLHHQMLGRTLRPQPPIVNTAPSESSDEPPLITTAGIPGGGEFSALIIDESHHTKGSQQAEPAGQVGPPLYPVSRKKPHEGGILFTSDGPLVYKNADDVLAYLETKAPQSVGRAVRRDDHEAADSDHIPEIFQIDTEQIRRNLNLLPLFGISPDNPISGSAPQAGQSPENVYVHDTTVGGSLIEEIIPVDKVAPHAVTPLFDIVWPAQQPQPQGENS